MYRFTGINKWLISDIRTSIATNPRYDINVPMFFLKKFRIDTQINRLPIHPRHTNRTIDGIRTSAFNVCHHDADIAWKRKPEITILHATIDDISSLNGDSGQLFISPVIWRPHSIGKMKNADNAGNDRQRDETCYAN